MKNFFRIACSCLAAWMVGQAVAAPDPFAEGVRPSDPLSPGDQLKTFQLPPGFKVQLVAAEPELRKPMNMAFDGAGRLWVTESREYPWPTNAAPRDTIRIFSDFNAEGRAQKVTTFATNLNIPIGLHPFLSPASSSADRGKGDAGRAPKLTWKCIAWSIPNIWLFEDTDGDGVADKRELLLGPFDHLRDTHGNQASFRRGYDGWIYATHGFNNRSRVTGKDGHEVFFPSGNTYRFRMDGSRVEHWTHGQVNPFGLTFDGMGNLYSADCHSSPIYQLLRGAWYPSFGAPDDGLGFAPLTVQHSHGSTAICGITVLDDPRWPAEFLGNLIIGNVMTSRINRDRVEWRGSTSVGHELPDFLSVTDPWFRPVDLQLGPDGALWVADFYNRIIGHYEVPLTHPGRDRERGRIWRIVPPAGADLQDLTIKAESIQALLGELASGNRTTRFLAMSALKDRFTAGELEGPLNALLNGKGEAKSNGEPQLVHALWTLEQVGVLEDKNLAPLLKDASPALRTHSLRVLTERALAATARSERTDKQVAGISTAQRAAAVQALQAADAQVQRAGADALGADAHASSMKPLIEFLERAPAADTHLRHVARMALRDVLANAEHSAWATNLTAAQSRIVADVCPAITNAAAATFLVGHLERVSEPPSLAARYLRHAARFLPAGEVDSLARLARMRFRDDMDLQASLFQSVHDGLKQRGIPLTGQVLEWGREVGQSLLRSVPSTEATWFPVDTAAVPTQGASPWMPERRKASDGRELEIVTTLSTGEKATGALRSKPFVAPERLTFWMAGHDGSPDKPLQGRNFVVLRDAHTLVELARAAAPRNDVAQPIHWELKPHAGKSVVIELVDGDTGSAYAWLSAGRFDSVVPQFPQPMPRIFDERLLAAAQIAMLTRDPELEASLAAVLSRPASPDARAAVATTLLSLNARQHLRSVGAIPADGSQPEQLRLKVAQAMAESNRPEARGMLLNALKGAPDRLAVRLALAMAVNRAGAEALLANAESRKLSPRLLQDRQVREKLVATGAPDADKRIEVLTRNLDPLNQELEKQIETRRATFKSRGGSPERGSAVFTRTCAACHQINGQGALVGPQLDGLGARGADRIIEDIVDPNRNVDHAFQATMFILEDGDVVSGLFRREEGETLVYAEATGKEIALPKRNVKERRASQLSLMPEGLADGLKEQEFNDLIAFLIGRPATPR